MNWPETELTANLAERRGDLGVTHEGCGSPAQSFSQQLSHKLSSLKGRLSLPATCAEHFKFSSATQNPSHRRVWTVLSQSLVLERIFKCEECYKEEQLVPVRRSLSNIPLSKQSKEEINGKDMVPASKYNERGSKYYAGSSRPTPLGPSQAIFSMGRKNPKHVYFLPIFLGGPMDPIHPIHSLGSLTCHLVRACCVLWIYLHLSTMSSTTWD